MNAEVGLIDETSDILRGREMIGGMISVLKDLKEGKTGVMIEGMIKEDMIEGMIGMITDETGDIKTVETDEKTSDRIGMGLREMISEMTKTSAMIVTLEKIYEMN